MDETQTEKHETYFSIFCFSLNFLHFLKDFLVICIKETERCLPTLPGILQGHQMSDRIINYSIVLIR